VKVVVEADGGSRGNPGPAGFGAVVRDATTGEVLAERKGTLGVATNNVAEYSGLIAGLTAAAELGAAEVEVRMDSKLVVEQMAGRWQIKNAGLRPLAAQAAVLVRRFARTTFTWIPRERNRDADRLANEAMDGVDLLPRPPLAAPDSPGRLAARAAAASAVGSGSAVGSAGSAGRARPSWEPRLTEPLRLLLIRHGETGLTAQRRYSGRGEVALTERGRHQAQAVAARVQGLGVPVTAVVSSPLGRCVATAEMVADGAPIVVDEDLVECDFGAWEGLTFAEVRERWPREMDAWLDSTAVAPPEGEPLTAVAERVSRAVSRLRESHPSGVVAVVSHVSPIKLILRDALGATDALLHRLYLDPAGLSIVDMWPDGGVAVRTVNDTAHLR